MRRKGTCDIYKIALQVHRQATAEGHEKGQGHPKGQGNAKGQGHSKGDIPLSQPKTDRAREEMEQKIKDLQNQCVDLKASFGLAMNAISTLQRETKNSIQEIKQQIDAHAKTEKKNLDSAIQNLIQKEESRFNDIQKQISAFGSSGVSKHRDKKQKAVPPPPPDDGGLDNKRVLRSKGIAKTKSHFPNPQNNSSEEEEDDNDSEEEIDHDDSELEEEDAEKKCESGIKHEICTNYDDESDTRSSCLDELVSSNPWNDRAEEREETDVSVDGIHNTLHQIIIGLRSQTYTQHNELDDMVHQLCDVARLEYPSASSIPDVSNRQAQILKMITCFYQTVCVVSMETSIPCDRIYGTADMMDEATRRVQAMM